MASSSAPAVTLDLAAEYHALRTLYDRQNEQGHALVADLAKAKADKEALQSRLDRGGPIRLLQRATPFHGQGIVEEWVDELEKSFSFFHVAEKEKVDTAVMLFKGPAANWWKTLQTKKEAPVVWADLVSRMKDMFQPISSIDRARTSLDHCVQGQRSVQAYTDAFRRLIQYLPSMDAGDQKHRYTSNLSASIRTEVIKAKPKTLEEAIHAAVSAEAYGAGSSGNRHTKHGGYFNPSRGWYGNPSSSSQASTSSSAMDISNLNFEPSGENGIATADGDQAPAQDSAPSSGPSARERQMMQIIQDLQTKVRVQDSIHAMFQPRGGSSGGRGPSGKAHHVPNLSKADYERCRRENRCLKCKEVDANHIARDCTKPLSLKW